MTKSWRFPVSPALVVSVIALVVALGGTSYAAFSLPRNSVGSGQLKTGAVTGRKVKGHSLLAADFKAGQLPRGPQGAKGNTGAQGPQGPKGDTGIAGSAGISGYEIVEGTAMSVPAGASAGASATCPADKKVLSGGAVAGTGLVLRYSAPLGNAQGWSAVATNQGNLSSAFTPVAVCANVN